VTNSGGGYLFYKMKFQHEWIETALDSIDLATTRRTYSYGLKNFWAWYADQGEPDLTPNVLNRYKRHAQNSGYATSTIAIDLAAVKVALEVNARPTDITDRLDLQDLLKISIKPTKPDNYSMALSVEERTKILATCPPVTPMGKRDLAILTVLFYQGLRRTEVENLTVNDYDKQHGMLFVREAKHHKSRAMPLHPLVISRIEAWLEIRAVIATCNSLFVNVQMKNKGKKLIGASVYMIMKRSCTLAGLPHYHPHDARATYITMLHDNGVNIGDIKTLAGHSSAQTTLGYVGMNLDALRKAVLTLQ
jgi:integrase